MWRFLIFIDTVLLVAILFQRESKLHVLRSIEKNMTELSDAVAAIANDLGEMQTAVQAVIDKLNQPNPDVAAAVSALQSADAGFDAIRDSLNNASGVTAGAGEPSA